MDKHWTGISDALHIVSQCTQTLPPSPLSISITKEAAVDFRTDKIFHIFKKHGASSNTGNVVYFCCGSQAVRLAHLMYKSTDVLKAFAKGQYYLMLPENIYFRAVRKLLDDEFVIKLWKRQGSSFDGSANVTEISTSKEASWIEERIITPGYFSDELQSLHDSKDLGVSLAVLIIRPNKNIYSVGMVTAVATNLHVYEISESLELKKIEAVFKTSSIREFLVRFLISEEDKDISQPQLFYQSLVEIVRDLQRRCFGIFCRRIEFTPANDDSIIISSVDMEELRCIFDNINDTKSDILGCSQNMLQDILSMSIAPHAAILLFKLLDIWKRSCPIPFNVFFHHKRDSLSAILGFDIQTYEFLQVFPVSNKCFSNKQQTFSFIEYEQETRTDSNKSLNDADKFRDCFMRDQAVVDYNSLFSILNVCCTSMGPRTLKSWLSQPLTDLQVLKERLNIVRLFYNNPSLRSNIRACLVKCCDFGVTVYNLSRNLDTKVTLKDLVSVFISIQQIRKIHDMVHEHSFYQNDQSYSSCKVKSFLLIPINALLAETQKFCLLVESLIDIDELSRRAAEGPDSLENIAQVHRDALYTRDELAGAMSSTRNKETSIYLRSSYSPDLALLSNALKDCQNRLDREKDYIVNSLEIFESKHGYDSRYTNSDMIGISPAVSPDYRSKAVKRKYDGSYASAEKMKEVGPTDYTVKSKLNISLAYSASFGYHLRVTNKYQHVILNYVNKDRDMESSFEVIILSSQKGGILFTTKQNYELLKSRYTAAQSIILADANRVAASFIATFLKCSEIVSSLDCLCAFAEVSHLHLWCEPTLQPLGSKSTNIVGARYPITELDLGPSNYVSSDYFIHASRDIEREPQNHPGHCLIMTGPNMGGKSTFLKAIGTIYLLSQIGCFVPATSAEISIIDGLLCHTAQCGSLLTGTSSFLSDMSDLRRIWTQSSANSLVLIDEIGVGTEAQSGYYIAREFIKKLILDVKCNVICTTHFRELCNLETELNIFTDDLKLPFVKKIITNFHVAAAANSHTMSYKVLPGVSTESMGIVLAEQAGFPEEIIRDSIDYLSKKTILQIVS